MAKKSCPTCGSLQVALMAKAERQAIAGSINAAVHKCPACGCVFEVLWPAWSIWLIMILGGVAIVGWPVTVVLVAVTGKPWVQGALMGLVWVATGVMLLGIVAGQRRLRQKAGGRGVRIFPQSQAASPRVG